MYAGPPASKQDSLELSGIPSSSTSYPYIDEGDLQTPSTVHRSAPVMDPQYGMNEAYPSGNRQSYTALPNFHSQLQQPSPANSQILPPLQPQRPPLNYANGGNGVYGTSSQLQQPLYAASLGQYANYPPQRMSQAPYTQPLQQYASNLSMTSQPPQLFGLGQQNSSAASQLQIPSLRPMPAGGMMRAPAPYHSVHTSASSDSESMTRTHVVGSQGRRGILPSAAGRPAAITQGGASSTKAPPIPEKDSDGKFPCPHCNKTYLHAKHLKRHLLRHTGDRPYSCILCGDTFSRSDILKRHFQKCSIRRGNPTGATHLSHSQSHLKKNSAKRQSMPAGAQPSLLPSNPSLGSSEIVGSGLTGLNGVQSDATPSSLSQNTKRYSDSTLQEKRMMNGQLPLGSTQASFPFSSNITQSPSHSTSSESVPSAPQEPHSADYATTYISDQMDGRGAPYGDGTHQVAMPYGRNSVPQQRSVSAHVDEPAYDWSYQNNQNNPGSGYASQMPQDQSNGLGMKSEAENSKGVFSGIAEDQQEMFHGLFGVGDPTGYREVSHPTNPTWNSHPLSSYQTKSERLIAYCTLDCDDQTTKDLTEWLSADNVEHFVIMYMSFQAHWPICHIPTFNPLEAYDGLVLVLVCIGAIYSDRLSQSQVRVLIARVRYAVEHTSHIFLSMRSNSIEPDYIERMGLRGLQELQSISLLQAISTWHGDPTQRQRAREDWSALAALGQRLRLFQLCPPESPNCSFLHQPSPLSEQISADNWSWTAWVWQEQCSRTMYIFWLMDVAMAIYFNCPPHYDAFEIAVPLPSDDAPWEARTAEECAAALGLFGPTAQSANVSGSRRRKQLEFNKVMRGLLHPTYEFEPMCTNVYSKFILIHALHVHVFSFQRQMAQGKVLHSLSDLGYVGNFCNPPMSDWLARNDGSGRTSNSNSGQVTPTDSPDLQSPGAHNVVKLITYALNKWKKMWDDDMPLQYPPDQKRIGFCRDGIHFYWLARTFLRNPQASDWLAPPDQRFMQVIATLKQIRTWVATDSAKRGEEIGSLADMDDSYGVADLTLDMKLLFAPLTPATPGYTPPDSGLGTMGPM